MPVKIKTVRWGNTAGIVHVSYEVAKTWTLERFIWLLTDRAITELFSVHKKQLNKAEILY